MGRSEEGYLKSIPVDLQACFRPSKSYDNNNYASNGRRFEKRGTAAPDHLRTTPEFGKTFTTVMASKVPEETPIYHEFVSFSQVVATSYKSLPYGVKAQKAVTPAEMKSPSFPGDASCLITPFQS